MRTVGLPESPKACRLDSTFPTLTDPWRDLQPRSDDSSMSTAIPSVPSISATQFPGTRAEAFLAQSLQCPCHFSAWFTSFVKVVARPRSKQTSWNQPAIRERPGPCRGNEWLLPSSEDTVQPWSDEQLDHKAMLRVDGRIRPSSAESLQAASKGDTLCLTDVDSLCCVCNPNT